MSSPGIAVGAVTVATSESAYQPEDPISRLAHDLRQPLSTIEAIAYYLEITLPADQLEALRYLTRLRRTVEETNAILSDAIREAQTRPAGET